MTWTFLPRRRSLLSWVTCCLTDNQICVDLLVRSQNCTVLNECISHPKLVPNRYDLPHSVTVTDFELHARVAAPEPLTTTVKAHPWLHLLSYNSGLHVPPKPIRRHEASKTAGPTISTQHLPHTTLHNNRAPDCWKCQPQSSCQQCVMHAHATLQPTMPDGHCNHNFSPDAAASRP